MKPHEETWEHVSGAYPTKVFYMGSSDQVAEVWAENRGGGPLVVKRRSPMVIYKPHVDCDCSACLPPTY